MKQWLCMRTDDYSMYGAHAIDAMTAEHAARKFAVLEQMTKPHFERVTVRVSCFEEPDAPDCEFDISLRVESRIVPPNAAIVEKKAAK